MFASLSAPVVQRGNLLDTPFLAGFTPLIHSLILQWVLSG